MAGQERVIERHTANGDGPTAFGNGVWTLVVVAGRDAGATEAERRTQEDAAIDAEDILTQAEEANALDPVG